MLIRRSFSGLLLAFGALLSAAPHVTASDTIPASCLVCRHSSSDTSFVRCLFRCLDRDDGIGLKPMEENGRPRLDGWSFKENPDAGYGKAVKTATLESDSAFLAFTHRVEPKLVLTRERNGEKRVFLDLNPAKLSPFEKPVTVRINRHDVFTVPVKAVWSNHAFLIDDPDFLRRLRHARHLAFTVETMGSMQEVVRFDTEEIRRVIRWLNGR